MTSSDLLQRCALDCLSPCTQILDTLTFPASSEQFRRETRGAVSRATAPRKPRQNNAQFSYCPFCGRGFIYLFFSVDTCYLHYSNSRKPGTGRERRGGVEEACAREAEAWVPSSAVLLLVSIPASAKWAGSATPLASPRDFLSHGRGSLRTCSVWENNP